MTSVGRLSTFEHISLLLVLGAFYDFHISLVLGPRLIVDCYEAGIYQCQVVLTFVRTISSGSNDCFEEPVRFSNFKKTKFSSLGNLSGFQIFFLKKCSQVSVEPVLIKF